MIFRGINSFSSIEVLERCIYSNHVFSFCIQVILDIEFYDVKRKRVNRVPIKVPLEVKRPCSINSFGHVQYVVIVSILDVLLQCS